MQGSACEETKQVEPAVVIVILEYQVHASKEYYKRNTQKKEFEKLKATTRSKMKQSAVLQQPVSFWL